MCCSHTHRTAPIHEDGLLVSLWLFPFQPEITNIKAECIVSRKHEGINTYTYTVYTCVYGVKKNLGLE